MLVSTGCNTKQSSNIPYWDGQSIEEFQGKTMTSMVWLKSGKGSKDRSVENMEVFKRFDGADFEVLLSCLENPEIKRPAEEGRLGEYLYLSFIDGTRYIIDFRFWHDKQYVILPNGQSKILYKLFGERESCPAFEPIIPGMDLYGRAAEPNAFIY